MSINPWGSSDPAEVAKGGTGASTLLASGVLLGSGTSPVTVTSGTDGQWLIGSTGADPVWAAPQGTTDEIDVSTGAGTFSFGLADDAVLPGTGSFKWVSGTTAQEPAGSAGEVRYDTDTDTFRGYIDGTGWVDFAAGGGSGAWTLLDAREYTGSGDSYNVDITGYTSIFFFGSIVGGGFGSTTFIVKPNRGGSVGSGGVLRDTIYGSNPTSTSVTNNCVCFMSTADAGNYIFGYCENRINDSGSKYPFFSHLWGSPLLGQTVFGNNTDSGSDGPVTSLDVIGAATTTRFLSIYGSTSWFS